jgi:hypothetical protein
LPRLLGCEDHHLDLFCLDLLAKIFRSAANHQTRNEAIGTVPASGKRLSCILLTAPQEASVGMVVKRGAKCSSRIWLKRLDHFGHMLVVCDRTDRRETDPRRTDSPSLVFARVAPSFQDPKKWIKERKKDWIKRRTLPGKGLLIQVRGKSLIIQVSAELTTIQCPGLVREGVDNNDRINPSNWSQNPFIVPTIVELRVPQREVCHVRKGLGAG